jgi:hypothetical protein
MKYEETQVSSIDHLVKVLRDLADPQDNAVCRGQAIASWPLEPSIDRMVPPVRKYGARLDEERCLIEQFRRRVQNLFGLLELKHIEGASPADLVLPLTVMQHYGAPTRLLDWTKSPFAAAFFAVIDSLVT